MSPLLWAQEAYAGGAHKPLSWNGWEGAAELAALLLLILTHPYASLRALLTGEPSFGTLDLGGEGGRWGIRWTCLFGGCAGISAGGPHPVLPSWPGPVGVSTTQLSRVPEHFQDQVLSACPRLASSSGSYDG